MLIQTLRKAHNEALRQLILIEVCQEEISKAKANKEPLIVEFYTEKKKAAIATYTEQMESIIEPVMLHHE